MSCEACRGTHSSDLISTHEHFIFGEVTVAVCSLKILVDTRSSVFLLP